jgi:Flp pilus assembly protein TadB
MTSLLFAFLLANRRQARIEKELPNWLASLIMKMRSGYSLQTALEQELRRNNAATRFHLNSIFRAVSFSPQTKSDRHVSTPHLILPPMIFGIAEEFRRINFLPNRQIEELQRWRDRLLVLESFRRKSKQAMSQARTQAVVLALIYFSLFVFLCIAFSWEHVRAATKVSIPLFLLGCWWIWHGGGRIKWTI